MKPLRLSLSELLYMKRIALEELSSKLSRESIIKARNDHHARRLPRPCGITVHVALGCTYRCTYCYVPDMGFSFREYRLYGLKGEELAYALLSNKAFLPGRLGTFIAIGSVGEPLGDDVLFSKTIEYLNSIGRHLGNPTQISTKAYLDQEKAKRLARVEMPLSILVTIVTLENHERLEPEAPEPWKRLQTIRRLRKAGAKPFLFLRPLIPGVNEHEVEEIIKEASRHGAYGVVVGGFRASPSILARLRGAGFEVSAIKERLRGNLTKGRQTPVYTRDLKERALTYAREKGLVAFLSACCANNYAAFLSTGQRVPCAGLDYVDGKFCTRCPVLCEEIPVEIDVEEAARYLRRYTSTTDVRVVDDGFYLRLRGGDAERAYKRLRGWRRIIVETAYRHRVAL